MSEQSRDLGVEEDECEVEGMDEVLPTEEDSEETQNEASFLLPDQEEETGLSALSEEERRDEETEGCAREEENEEMEEVRRVVGGGVPEWVVGQEEELRFLGGFSVATRKKHPLLFSHAPNLGFHNLFYAAQNNPLLIWDKGDRCGVIKRTMDEDGSLALRIVDQGKYKEGYTSTFITTPCAPFRSLGIHLPYMLLTLKNMNQDFTFRVLVRDSTNAYRSLVFTTRLTMAKRTNYGLQVPLRLEMGWNHLAFDLNSYIYRAYRTYCKEVIRVTVFPNCRLRMINFVNTPITIHHEVAILSQIMKESLRTKMMDPNFDRRFDGCETQFVLAKVRVPDTLRDYLSRASIKRQADAVRLKERERVPLHQPKTITRPPPSPRREYSHPRRSLSSRNVSVCWREAYARKSTELIRSQSRHEQMSKLRRVTEDAVKLSFAEAQKRTGPKVKKTEKRLERSSGVVSREVVFGPPAPIPLLDNNPDLLVVGASGNRLTVVDLGPDSDAVPKEFKPFQIGSQTYLVELGSEDNSTSSSVIRLLAQETQFSSAARPSTVTSAYELRSGLSPGSDTDLDPPFQSPGDPLYEEVDGLGPIWTSTLNAQNTVLVNALNAWTEDPPAHSRQELTAAQESAEDTPLLIEPSSGGRDEAEEGMSEVPLSTPEESLPMTPSALSLEVKTKLRDKLSALFMAAAEHGAWTQEPDTPAQDEEAESESGMPRRPEAPEKTFRWEKELSAGVKGGSTKASSRKTGVTRRGSGLSLGQKKAELLGFGTRDRGQDLGWSGGERWKKPPVPRHVLQPRKTSSRAEGLREAGTGLRQSEETKDKARRDLRNMKKLIQERREDLAKIQKQNSDSAHK